MDEPGRLTAANLPSWRDAINALALITRLPLASPAIADRRFAQASVFFPVIGLLVGIVLTVLARTTAGASLGLPAAALLVLAWEALGTSAIRAASTEARLGRAATLALALGLKAWLLVSSGTLSTAGLLFAPLLGRWSLVVLAVGSRSADRSGQKFSPAVTFREFGVASLIAFALVFTLGQLVGLILIIACSAVTLLLRLAFHRWQGGITWSTVVAGMHVVEITALAALALVG